MVTFAIGEPADVDVSEIIFRPTAQDLQDLLETTTMPHLCATMTLCRPLVSSRDASRARLAGALGGLTVLLGLIAAGCGCGTGQASTPGASADTAPAPATRKESPMWMTVGERRFAIALADDPAARAFVAQLPLTLEMSELNGNEKHAELPRPLPAKASRPGTIRAGDLMLYGEDTLVVFYATFESAYSYTRLGRIAHPEELADALGRRGVRVRFSRE